MELYKELMLGAVSSNQPQIGVVALMMPGNAPINADQVKAAVDIYDIQDMYAKCLGISILSQARTAGASLNTVAFNQMSNKTALKKGDLDWSAAFDGTGANAGLRKASIPDRFYLCRKDAPFDRITEKTGMAGLPMTSLMPWAFFENAATDSSAIAHPGRSTHPDGTANLCTELVWESPRTFAGIIRGSTKGSTVTASYVASTMVVDAWNGSAWETVLASKTKNGYLASDYVAFSKRISTTRLRIQWASGDGFLYPHGLLPIEVIADAPAPSAVADIGWAILLPLYGNRWPAQAKCARWSLLSNPVPAIIAKAGGPGDGAGFEIIFSKKTGIMSTDRVSCTGFKLTSSNLIGA